MSFEPDKRNLITRTAFMLAIVLFFAVGVFAQQPGKNSSNTKSSGAVRLKKAMVIGRKNPILVNPSSRRSNRLISVGVLNARAKNLVVPNLGENWRREIRVQATIDETGRVTSAKSVEKNLAMRRAAERAARQSTFMPVVLRGQARRAVGVILYKPIS